MIVSTACGMLLDVIGISPIKALYWSAMVNGLLAPFLLGGIALVAADRKLMQDQPSPRHSVVIVGLTSLLMLAAGVAMLVF